MPCDVFMPCGLGQTLTIDLCTYGPWRAICGAANNQLAVEEDAKRLLGRGILYAPDFVVNAGGLINVSEEIRGYNEEKAKVHIERVYDNTLRVLHTAHEQGMSPHHTAVELAMERIHKIGNLRLFRRSGEDRA